MNLRKVISCFLAAAAICMTCSLTGCRKEDGKHEGTTSMPTMKHTEEPRATATPDMTPLP